MATDQALTDILDETFSALSAVSICDKLQSLRQRIVLLAEFEAGFGRTRLAVFCFKKRRLEIILQNYQVDLDALSRLHLRSMRNQWAQ